MSERVTVTIRCRKADLDKHRPAWEESLACSYSIEGSVVVLEFAEVDHGNIFRSDDFPPQIPFIGSHGASDNFTAKAIVHDGIAEDNYASVWSCVGDEYLFAIDEQGDPVATDRWRKFWTMRERIRLYVEAGESKE